MAQNDVSMNRSVVPINHEEVVTTGMVAERTESNRLANVQSHKYENLDRIISPPLTIFPSDLLENQVQIYKMEACIRNSGAKESFAVEEPYIVVHKRKQKQSKKK